MPFFCPCYRNPLQPATVEANIFPTPLYPARPPETFMRLLITVFLPLAFIANSDAEEPTKTNLTDVIAAFDKNPTAAKEYYTGKPLDMEITVFRRVVNLSDKTTYTLADGVKPGSGEVPNGIYLALTKEYRPKDRLRVIATMRTGIWANDGTHRLYFKAEVKDELWVQPSIILADKMLVEWQQSAKKAAEKYEGKRIVLSATVKRTGGYDPTKNVWLSEAAKLQKNHIPLVTAPVSYYNGSKTITWPPINPKAKIVHINYHSVFNLSLDSDEVAGKLLRDNAFLLEMTIHKMETHGARGLHVVAQSVKMIK